MLIQKKIFLTIVISLFFNCEKFNSNIDKENLIGDYSLLLSDSINDIATNANIRFKSDKTYTIFIENKPTYGGKWSRVNDSLFFHYRDFDNNELNNRIHAKGIIKKEYILVKSVYNKFDEKYKIYNLVYKYSEDLISLEQNNFNKDVIPGVYNAHILNYDFNSELVTEVILEADGKWKINSIFGFREQYSSWYYRKDSIHLIGMSSYNKVYKAFSGYLDSNKFYLKRNSHSNNQPALTIEFYYKYKNGEFMGDSIVSLEDILTN